MATKKMIIHYDDVDPEIALMRVMAVVKNGRVSDYSRCYCFVTTFTDQTMVIADRTKTGTDTFRVKLEEAGK